MERRTTRERAASRVTSAAPGDLEIVRGLINTLDVEGSTDAISSEDGLRRWLVDRSLLDPDDAVGQADVGWVIEVREALRELIVANSDGVVDDRAVAVLNDASHRSPLEVRFDRDGNAGLVARGSGVTAAVSRLLAVVEGAMADGTWARLKACRNDACRWAFYDRSKNRSGTWCTMAVCGNVMKAREYRRRKAAGGSS